MPINGTAGDDTLNGTAGADLFDIKQGGIDKVTGYAGNDTIEAGGSLTAADSINGGAGTDLLVLDGDYSAGLTFGLSTVRYIDEIEMRSGHSYDITTADSTVEAGATLKVSAYGVGWGVSGQQFRFDGSAETNGNFLVYDSFGNDTVIGGAGDDYFVMAYGGQDSVVGGDGNDILSFGAGFGAGDVADGGAGADVLYLTGDYPSFITLGGANVKGIESVIVYGDFNFKLGSLDSLLTAGQVLNLDARSLGPAYSVTFNGLNETDGSYDFYDGKGNDYLVGGAGADLFRMMSGGTDTMVGGAGDDSFYMEGNLTAADRLSGGAGYDWIDLTGDYSAGVTLSSTSLAGIERFVLRAGYSYKLTFNDANVKNGESMLIGGDENPGAGNWLNLDASAETSASYTMYDSGGNDTLAGGGGNDVFWLKGGNDSAKGNGGNDSFVERGPLGGFDTLDGGAGTDGVTYYYADKGVTVNLTTGTATSGAGHSDTLISIENADGSQFNDTLFGDAGVNHLAGNDGNDVLVGRGGADWLFGGAGIDRISYSGSTAAVTVSLGAGTGSGGDAEGDWIKDVEYLTGSALADVLTGSAGANRIEGAAGPEAAGAGDTIRGAGGADTLLGGGGADVFNYSSVNDSKTGSVDVILDFSSAQGDLIRLVGIDANTTLAGDQAFSFIGGAAFSAAGQLRFAGGQVLGDIDGNGVADLVISMTGVASMTASDFQL